MFRVFLGLGSNIGDRVQFLSQAISMIEQFGTIEQISSVYETEPVGMTDANPFYNLTVEISTEKQPQSLLNSLKKIETKLGRSSSSHMKPRVIDIDILLVDGYIYNDEQLEIPHAELANRRFVLEPLNELAPQLVHPVLHQSISTLLMNCSDTHTVTRTEIILPFHRTMEIA
ncbi:MAG: 2-amino-4-hydroxy-6-hydroxymethyldihydropteridine diphosphokinase [Ignavibacteriae bacterium]|nr:2-amino-4-hydroxy-6-hydroxymethyldihydropteridine diphosphokinase [Ignavibacteriota bacterium]